MRELCRFLLLFSAGALLFAAAAHGQDDSPSLGDVARQARLQKQQKQAQEKAGPATAAPGKDSPGKDAQGQETPAKDAQPKAPKKVITNDEIPEHVGPTRTLPPSPKSPVVSYATPNYRPAPAEFWKSQIEGQRNNISMLQRDIDRVNALLPYVEGNCVADCAQQIERKKALLDQLDSMKAQLAQQQKRLEDMQEAARKQGYGSSVYDP